MNWFDKKDKEYFSGQFFSRPVTRKTWFEFSKIKLYRSGVKCFELAGVSSYRGTTGYPPLGFVLSESCKVLNSNFSCACFLDLCLRLLEYSLQDDKVRSQDSVAVIDSIAMNPEGRLIAWRFVQAKYKLLFNR